MIKKVKVNFHKALVLTRLFPGNDPSFFIIGAQKAGTSSLHHYLGQHPDLSPSFPKETHYFDSKVYYGKRLDWYKKHFIQSWPSQKLFFESTPNYLYHEDVAIQISQLYPKAKLIVVLREPVARAYSAWNMYRDMVAGKKSEVLKTGPRPGVPSGIYIHYMRDRKEFPSFEEAIQIELALIEKGLDNEPSLLRRGLYAGQLKKYLKYFSKDQILVLGFRDLTSNLQQTLNKTCAFLEVKPIAVENLSLEVRNKRVYTEKMGADTKATLQEFFKAPNEQLFELLGYMPNW